MRPKSFFSQIFLAFILIAILAVVAITWITSRSWRHFYLGELAGDLEARARLTAVLVGEKLEQGGAAELQAFCRELGRLSDTHVTVVLAGGRVAGDSLRDPQTMANQEDLPEIRAAFAGQVGKEQRFESGHSHTTMYVAVPVVQQGKTVAVVRTALPVNLVHQALTAVYLKVAHGKVTDVMYQVMGCAGAVSAAMAAVDLVKGEKVEDARNLEDGDIFRVLEDIPVKKHHCIQLAVKALHKTIDAYQQSQNPSLK